MDTYRVPTVIAVLVIVVVVAAAAVITVTQRDRADAASAHTTRLESTLAQTQAELASTQNELSFTSDSLTTVEQTLQDARQESTQTQTTLTRQAQTCRYVVRINDHLLRMASFQQNATTHLLRDNRRAARRAVGHAHRQTRAVQILVQRSGYRSLSALVSACAPTQ
jgi:septal ring factor EnvC (AmiA/AmiB activator)